MTSDPSDFRAGSAPPPLLDPLAEQLTWASAGLAVDCFVEAHDGSVASHAVRPAAELSPAVADALLRRDAGTLRRALTRTRAVAVTPAGAVVAGSVAGVPAMLLPLRTRWAEATWWVLGSADPSAEVLRHRVEVEQAVDAVSGVLRVDVAAAVLDGDAPVAPHMARGPFRVAAVQAVGERAGGAGPALARCVAEVPSGQFHALATHGADRVDVLLSGEGDDARAVALVERWMSLAQRRGISTTAGLSAPSTTAGDLPALRAQARHIVSVLPSPGSCVPVADARAHLVLDAARETLLRASRLFPDPLERLAEYDARRGGQLQRSILAWLDAHGDVVAAAGRLGVHPNTLRYRLDRGQRLLEADLDDPTTRLEIHVRLHLMQSEPARR